MKKFLLIFLLGAGAGAGGWWFWDRAKTQGQFAETRDRVTYAAWKAGKSLKEAADEIKEEFNKTGIIVRDKAKAATESVTSAVGDTTVTASVKAKMLGDSSLRGVSVETERGVVTLSGAVTTHEDIARAMKLALDIDGAQRVVSKLQLSAAKAAPTAPR